MDRRGVAKNRVSLKAMNQAGGETTWGWIYARKRTSKGMEERFSLEIRRLFDVMNVWGISYYRLSVMQVGDDEMFVCCP